MAQLKDTAINGSVKINNNPVADFIVEQGTSGNWIYRKWNSGNIELWTNITGASSYIIPWYGMTVSDENKIFVSDTISSNFPFTLSNINMQLSLQSTKGGFWIYSDSMSTASTGFTGVRLARIGKVTDTRSYNISVYINATL